MKTKRKTTYNSTANYQKSFYFSCSPVGGGGEENIYFFQAADLFQFSTWIIKSYLSI